MDIEFQTFKDADGNEVQGVPKELFEQTTSELNQKLEDVNKRLNDKEHDISGIKKKFSDLSEEEIGKMSKENQQIMKDKEEMQIRLDQIENERQNEYKQMSLSKYSSDEEQLAKIKANFDRISLTEEEKKLSLREQIELKTELAVNMVGIEKPSALNITSNGYTQPEEVKKDYSNTGEGIEMSARMLGVTVEKYKELNNIK